MAQQQEKRLGRVLLIYRRMIPSILLCGHCQMEYLARQGLVEYRAVQEMELQSSDLNWANIVLLGRLDSWYECRLAQKLSRAGKYLIYILDDDLLGVPNEISSAAYYGRKEVQQCIREMLGLSDAILSPSLALLEKYAVNGKARLLVEEPAMEPVLYQPHEKGEPVRLGFAGSIDRTGDIELILRDALIRVKREFGDRIQIEFFGAIPSFADELNARCIPYCDSYDEYRDTLNRMRWDIGLAPMPETAFHACKHYNKFIEYSAAGCMTIHSAVQPYLRLAEFGCAEAVPNDSESWIQALRRAIQDDAYREDMRRRSNEFVRERMNCPVTALQLYRQISKQYVPKEGRAPIGGIGPIKVIGYALRASIQLRILGKRSPNYVWQRIRERLFRTQKGVSKGKKA